MTTNLQDATMRDLITNQLESLGWTKSDGAAIASKLFDTAVGQKISHIYFSSVGGESNCYLLQGEYWSEGRNALSTCMLTLPKDIDLAQVPALIAKYVDQADDMVHETYAARLYRSVTPAAPGHAEQNDLRDILVEAAAIIAAIPKRHEPDNMRSPIVDELEGVAGMLADGIQPNDIHDILIEASSIIAAIPQGHEPANMRFPIVAELEEFTSLFAPSVSSTLKP